MNPTATDPLLPSEFRHPAPSSQPEPVLPDNFPNKTKNVDSIYYYPRSHRTFVEPQTLIVTAARSGVTKIEAVSKVGTLDAPFTPVTLAKDAPATLRIDRLAEFKKVVDEFSWDKPLDMSLPQYHYAEVPMSEWLPTPE